MLLAIGLILFLLLIITHEMGHFIAAKRNGVEPEEFGIFFPPKLWGKKMKGGWEFTINARPLGGFVKLKGEHDSDTEKGSFGAASDAAKAKIMLAGVAVNFVTAFVLFTFLALVGMPKIIENQFTVASDTNVVKQETLVGYVDEKSPAAAGGIKQRDKLISISNATQTVRLDGETLSKVTQNFAGQKVTVAYERSGDLRSTTVQLRDKKTVQESAKTENPVGYLGVVPPPGPPQSWLQGSALRSPSSPSLGSGRRYRG